jgi:hypothetical protein
MTRARFRGGHDRCNHELSSLRDRASGVYNSRIRAAASRGERGAAESPSSSRSIGAQFLRQQDCIPFARPEMQQGRIRLTDRRTNFEPDRAITDPLAYKLRGARV